MDTSALDDTIQFISDTAAQVVDVKNAGQFNLSVLENLFTLAPEAIKVAGEASELWPEIETLDQATAIAELGKAAIAIKSLVQAILYKPATSKR